MKQVAIVLFEEFETLDVFGPVEIFGRIREHYQIQFYSITGGVVRNSHGVELITANLAKISQGTDIFVLPGGWGTRPLVNDAPFIDLIKQIAQNSQFVLTVCTGSALLAKTGLLSGKNATSNKRAFDWVVTQDSSVIWHRAARWTVDGKYYTSAGVSAGMDMTLGFLADTHSLDFAREIAAQIEYSWQENKNQDEFAS
ncbi:MAG: DJ-1/PfpI family protein [Microscillaceae bacterium]|jgi:putative intracellular protease/amidase|nr:DJ-1/PfpI family protein [Microscillaceae bacterium]